MTLSTHTDQDVAPTQTHPGARGKVVPMGKAPQWPEWETINSFSLVWTMLVWKTNLHHLQNLDCTM